MRKRLTQDQEPQSAPAPVSANTQTRARFDRLADEWDVKTHGTGPLFADYDSPASRDERK